MDSAIEINFVRENVKKEYRDRLLFELQSKKHREKAISRFAHTAKEVLQDKFKEVDLDYLNILFADTINPKPCYLITGDKHDGEYMALFETWNYIQKTFLVAIVISNDFVLIKEEYEINKPTFFLRMRF